MAALEFTERLARTREEIARVTAMMESLKGARTRAVEEGDDAAAIKSNPQLRHNMSA